MKQMGILSTAPAFNDTVATLIGNVWSEYCYTVTNAYALGGHHPFGLSFKGLDVGSDSPMRYPRRLLYLLAHIDEPNKSFNALTSVVRFVFDREKHEGVTPYLRTFDAGDYQFFEIGSHHGVYLCGHPINADMYLSRLRQIEHMIGFLSEIWRVPVEQVILADPEAAQTKCIELKLLFCNPRP
jgi:hypothetical protein